MIHAALSLLCEQRQPTLALRERHIRGAIVWLPVGLPGGPCEEEVASRGHRHVVASRAALDVGEAALIV